MKKPFIITIDTEGDSLWENPTVIETKNAQNLPRFQELCNKYGFKPVYLTDYEMICDDWFVDFVSQESGRGNCEIGLHIHAWNSPPFDSELAFGSSQPFLSEFPREEMKKKVSYLKGLIENKTGMNVVSHRAGRWGLSTEYASVLLECGIEIDCSVTPYVDWSRTVGYQAGGPDFSKARNRYYYMAENCMTKAADRGLLEVPVSIVPASRLNNRIRHDQSMLAECSGKFGRLLNKKWWLRPSLGNLGQMLKIVEHSEENEYQYLEFILHSSEFSAGLNPTFKTEEQIESLYNDLEVLFSRISSSYYGCTLSEFGERVARER